MLFLPKSWYILQTKRLQVKVPNANFQNIGFDATQRPRKVKSFEKLNESGTLVYREDTTVLYFLFEEVDPIENTLKASTTLLLSYLSSSRCTQMLSISKKR